MTRLEDWPLRLNAVIEAAAGRPFSWGEHDCCLFAADCVKAITGTDPMADVRGTYATEEEAGQLLAEAPLRARLSALFGGAVPITLARRGDLLLFKDALGVCLGERGAFVGPEGVSFVPVSCCLDAWRVG